MVLLTDICLFMQAANWRRAGTGRLGSSAMACRLSPAAPISANSVPVRIIRIPPHVSLEPADAVCGGGCAPQGAMLATTCQSYPDMGSQAPGTTGAFDPGCARCGQPLIIHADFRQRAPNRRGTRCPCRTAILTMRMLYFRLTGGFAGSRSKRADRPERMCSHDRSR